MPKKFHLYALSIICVAAFLVACSSHHRDNVTKINFTANDESNFTDQDGTLEIHRVQSEYYATSDCIGNPTYIVPNPTQDNWWKTYITLASLPDKMQHINLTYIGFKNAKNLIISNQNAIKCVKVINQYRTSTNRTIIAADHDIFCSGVKYNSNTQGYNGCKLRFNTLLLRKT